MITIFMVIIIHDEKILIGGSISIDIFSPANDNARRAMMLSD